MGVSNVTGKRLKNIKDSAVSGHLLQCNSIINFDHFDILTTDLNKFNLSMKDSILIKRDSPVLKRPTNSSPLELFDWFYYHCFLGLYQVLLLLYPSD